jgi:hypothetical protein
VAVSAALQNMRLSASQWIGWWYIAIGIGFALLAISHVLTGGAVWLIALRIIVAAGFVFLGWMELRSKKSKK